MKSRGIRLFVLAAAFAAVPATADAARFCVKDPTCVAAGGKAKPTVQAALDAAAQNGGGIDRVELGAHAFADGPFTAVDGNPVRLLGAGRSKTTLTGTLATGEALLELGDADSEVRNLGVALQDGSDVSGIRTPGGVNGVRVDEAGEGNGRTAVTLSSGGSLSRSRIAMSTSGAHGVDAVGRAQVSRTSIRAFLGIFARSETGLVRATRVRITVTGTGILVISGNAVLDQATIRMLGGAIGETGISAFAEFGSPRLEARHVTVVGSGSAGTVGATVYAQGSSGACRHGELILQNSIIRGFETDLRRFANDLGCTDEPSADLDVAFSVFDPESFSEFGPGAFDSGPGNRDVNPRFVDQGSGNYHLKRSSPVIDKGQPGKPKAGESKVDLDGRNRVVNGDGKGGARRDMGAFEFRP